ncbi:MAG TPA: Gmad2 immunoglobulin-like domain-containing protein [Candidatus Limnocylindria bacterium]|nr:Gmad2 immunoglobulin-like domain-containing protein [Candidatus Limnocylindria bacterium]
MTRHDTPDDDLMAELAAALRAEAGQVEPSPHSLDRIRGRVHESSGRTAWRWAAPMAVAAVVVGVVSAAVFVPSDEVTAPIPGGSVTPSPTLPATPPPTPSPSTCFTSGPYLPVPTYLVKTFEGRTALYRVFTGLPHPCAGPEFPEASAVGHAISVMGAPDSRGYQSLWPNGVVMTGFDRTGASARVSVNDDPDGDPDLALQQLVYTVTAADNSISSVTVTTPSRSFPEATRAPQAEVLAPVWLTDAVAEESADGYRITMSGTASVFEATVNWTITDEDGTVVDTGFAMTPEAAPARGEWSAKSKPLPLGRSYTVTAYESSPQDGRVTWPDTKNAP